MPPTNLTRGIPGTNFCGGSGTRWAHIALTSRIPTHSRQLAEFDFRGPRLGSSGYGQREAARNLLIVIRINKRIAESSRKYSLMFLIGYERLSINVNSRGHNKEPGCHSG